MAAQNCRIGKIRLKQGGAEIRVLPDQVKRNSEAAFAKLQESFKEVENFYTDSLDGFCLVTWNSDGQWSCYTKRGAILHDLTLPEFVANAVRMDYAQFLAADLLEKANE